MKHTYSHQDLTTLGAGNIYSCIDCGAFAALPELVEHHPTCVPGESKKWERHYNQANEEEAPGASMVELKDIRLIWAGNAIFTMRSKKTNTRFTYKIVKSKPNPRYLMPRYWVYLLAGPDNVNSYVYIGWTPGNGRYLNVRKDLSPKQPGIAAFIWLCSHIDEPSLILAQAELFHQGRCCKCGRVLTVPESILAGIGPECERNVYAR